MSRKRKKMTLAEIRFNLILLAILFGVSVALIYGRFLFVPPDEAPLPAQVLPTEPETHQFTAAPQKTPEIKPEPKDGTVPPVAIAPESRIVAATPAEKAPAAEKTAPAEKTVTVPKPVSAPKTVKVPKPDATPKTVPPAKKPPAVKPVPVAVAVSAPPPERPVPERKKGTLVFVFDDAGHNLAQLEPFLRLPFPCTIAVLPGLRYSAAAAQRIRAAGKEVILHQPMQALNLSIDPGPGAIRKGMKGEEIRSLVRGNMAEIGPVAGINNHEGSLITADRPSMDTLLDFARDNGIYFLDSRTNAETVVPALAREKKMTIWERAVFLDNIQDRSLIIEAVNTGMKIAERKGAAVMIGHIWSNDLAAILTEMYPELVSQGFSLSTIAEIAVSGDDEE